MAPARASASGRVAHCPSCFSYHRGHLLLPPFLPPLFPLASGSGGWMACSLAFLTPFFTRETPRPSSLSPRSKIPSTILRWTPVQRNFAQWRNLAITIACPYSRSYPIAYTSPLPAEVSSPTLSPCSSSSVLVLHYACASLLH